MARSPFVVRGNSRANICDQGGTVDIQEFVGESLRQIVAGVKRAQQEAQPLGARVNPSGLRAHLNQGEGYDELGRISRTVEFDIAVTVEHAKRGEAEGRLRLAVVGIGAHVGKELRDTTISRVRFSVPVLFPKQDGDPGPRPISMRPV